MPTLNPRRSILDGRRWGFRRTMDLHRILLNRILASYLILTQTLTAVVFVFTRSNSWSVLFDC